MTPKWHRRTADALRDAVDGVDTWINGPDDEPTTPFLPPDDTPTLLWPTVWQEGGEPLPVKVSPNVDHTPPPMTCATHGPGCPNLLMERELVDLEWQQANASALAYAEAVAAWNRGEL